VRTKIKKNLLHWLIVINNIIVVVKKYTHSIKIKSYRQAVQNAAVRLIFGARKFDHVTPLLREGQYNFQDGRHDL